MKEATKSLSSNSQVDAAPDKNRKKNKKIETYINRYLKRGVWKSIAHVIKYAIPCLPFWSIS